jgi:hypothetical protein
MEIRNIIYLPIWVRLLALVILGIGFVVGVFFAYYFVSSGQGGQADYILVALFIAQMAAYGLIIALVVFYSEREVSIDRLLARLDEFLEISLPAGLRRIRIPVFSNLATRWAGNLSRGGHHGGRLEVRRDHRERLFDLGITRVQLGGVKIKEGEGLLEDKEMLRAPGARQRQRDLVRILLAAIVA